MHAKTGIPSIHNNIIMYSLTNYKQSILQHDMLAVTYAINQHLHNVMGAII